MKNIFSGFLLLVLVSIIIPLNLIAKDTNSSFSISSKLMLMEPLNHKIQVNCLNLDRRYYFIDEFILSKTDILNSKINFFLNADFVITEVKIDTVYIPLKVYRNYKENSFMPPIEPELFNIIKQKAKLYEIVFDNLTALPELVTIKIKYHIFDEDRLQKNVRDWCDFKGHDFWYPRNFNRDEKIDLKVKTTDQYSFYLNGKTVSYEVDKYLKTYSVSFTDYHENPSVIMFRKAKLK